MKKLIIKLCIFFFLYPISKVASQDFKFKNVALKELTEGYHPKDSSAPAAVLFEKGELNMKYKDGFIYELKVSSPFKLEEQVGLLRQQW